MQQRLLIVRQFELLDYQQTWQAMKDFTEQRSDTSADEIWLLEHPPVFTQGLAGKPEHLLNPENIPVIQSDRGGQVTYHGPGQLVVYTMLDLHRLSMGTRNLVRLLEQSVIEVLKGYDIVAENRCDAPGIYIAGAKICSIGLRVRKGCSYHGIAFNLNMDLQPFSRINPCGIQNLRMTQLADWVAASDATQVRDRMIRQLVKNFAYQENLITYLPVNSAESLVSQLQKGRTISNSVPKYDLLS